jgi:hypothetical protein
VQREFETSGRIYGAREPSLAFQSAILCRDANESCHALVTRLIISFVWNSPVALSPSRCAFAVGKRCGDLFGD